MDSQQTPTAGTPIYQESQEKNAKWLWFLIVLIIVGAVILAFVRGIGPFSRFKSSSAEASPSPVFSPVSSPAIFSSPSPEATSGADELDKSEVSIRVLNGSGVAGIASAVKDFLEGKGWTVDAVGNADSYDFEQTTLIFKEGFAKFEQILTEDLSDKYSVTTSEEILEATDSADIEIIVGSK